MAPTTAIRTAKAPRYLQQLCKHFGHKAPVTFTPTQGRIELPFGARDLAADAAAPTMSVQGADPEKTARVMADHLTRFAFRETLEINWTQGPQGDL